MWQMARRTCGFLRGSSFHQRWEEGAGRLQGRKKATDITKISSPSVGFFGSENDFPAGLQAPRDKGLCRSIFIKPIGFIYPKSWETFLMGSVNKTPSTQPPVPACHLQEKAGNRKCCHKPIASKPVSFLSPPGSTFCPII